MSILVKSAREDAIEAERRRTRQMGRALGALREADWEERSTDDLAKHLFERGKYRETWEVVLYDDGQFWLMRKGKEVGSGSVLHGDGWQEFLGFVLAREIEDARKKLWDVLDELAHLEDCGMAKDPYDLVNEAQCQLAAYAGTKGTTDPR